MRSLLTFTVFVLFALSVGATNYYVDWAGGNDANNGTSTSTPWQHAPYDTGGPARTLVAGDVVNFKLGVTYNSSHTIIPTCNGTAGSPITYQAATGWGSGVAAFDGITGGTTNIEAIEISGRYITLSGLQISNYILQATGNFNGEDASGLVVSNCIIHHIGYFPYISANGGGGNGFGVRVQTCANVTIVSNLMYDLNETAVYNTASVTNTVVWGNTITNVQDHASYFGGQGWSLIAFNSVHDQQDPNSHDDNFQIQSWGLYGGTTNSIVICGNWFYNGNSDTFFNALGSCGIAYIFDNVMFQTYAQDGQSGFPTSILVNTQQNPWDTFYIFNNTILFKNGNNGALTFAQRGGANWGTNDFLYNNVIVESLWNEPLGTDAENVHHTYSGYNIFTNNSRSVSGYINGLTLAGLQSGYPAQEINSIYGNVQFVNRNNANLPASDFHLVAGSPGTGAGTNLSTLIPANTFSFLPAVFQVDPTKSSELVARGSSWDMGAFQGTHDPSITSQPTDQTVTAPATATFSLTATGTPTLTYQWYKNGVSIGGATSASYTTPATTIGDNGSTFYCVVSGPGPNSPVTSSTATLHVNSPGGGGTVIKTYGKGTRGKSTR